MTSDPKTPEPPTSKVFDSEEILTAPDRTTNSQDESQALEASLKTAERIRQPLVPPVKASEQGDEERSPGIQDRDGATIQAASEQGKEVIRDLVVPKPKKASEESSDRDSPGTQDRGPFS